MHWQTRTTSVEHQALGVAGLGYEGSSARSCTSMIWPNCFETSPCVVVVVMVAIEHHGIALRRLGRLGLGTGSLETLTFPLHAQGPQQRSVSPSPYSVLVQKYCISSIFLLRTSQTPLFSK